MKTKAIRKKESGQALVIVLVLSALFILAVHSLYTRIQSVSQTGGMVLAKQKAAYIAEGVVQVADKLAQDYLLSDPAPTTAKLNAYVASRITAINVAPYTISSLNQTLGAVSYGAIAGGPFFGMDSMQVPVQTDVRISDGSNVVNGAVTKNTILGQVNLFQFTLFGDMPGATTYLAPGMPMDVTGRIHINGDFCVGNFGTTPTPLRMQQITSSGGIYNLRDASCWAGGVGVADNTLIATDPTFTTFSELIPGADHGCTNCNNTGMPWRTYATSTWGGQAQDTSHQVKPLRLPVQGSDQVQYGVKADLSQVSNTGSLRVLVDPILSTDTAAVQAQKMASKADIRIINGVWYLQDPSNPTSWPGLPIWSDHPGHFVATNEEGIEGTLAVGQGDIRTRWSGTANQWPLVGTPLGYSYYSYDSLNGAAPATASAVISYGTLFKSGATWHPGQWAAANTSALCTGGHTCTNCSDTAPLDALIAGSINCSGGAQPSAADFVLNGTRSGFRDGNVAVMSAGASPVQVARSKIYPVNFDVGAFQAALTNNGPGELGSYFGAGNLVGRPFNGIIYITQTWAGAMQGVNSGIAADYPFQGAQTDSSQAAVTHAAQQQALPFPLCSGSLAGQPYDGPGAMFRVPDCDRYNPTYLGPFPIQARPNVVRVFNGSNLNPAVLPNGFTVATNMGTYVMGDYNTSSDTSSAVATPWVPALIAADQSILLSNAWDDANSRWDVPISSLNRVATNTTYQFSLLSGGTATTPTAWSGGLENLPRYVEKWNNGGSTATVKIRGSLVMGFSSVYFRNPIGPSNPIAWGAITYLPPQRDFGYDPHLSSFLNSPPGTPRFDIYSVLRWVAQ